MGELAVDPDSFIFKNEKKLYKNNFNKDYSLMMIVCDYKIKSNLSLFLLYYSEACIKFAGPSPRSIAPAGNTAPFEEVLLRWRAVSNAVSNLAGPRIEPPSPETNALPLDHLPGSFCDYNISKRLLK